MKKPASKLRVAAVADLHTHATHQGEYRQLFADLNGAADIVALAGDLTNLGLPEEAEHLAADLASLRIPVVAVMGNHDHHHSRAAEVQQILQKANVMFLEGETFEHNGVGFAGVKGFGGGFGAHMLNAFGEQATKAFVTEAVDQTLLLENALKSLATERVVVVLHYSPIAETARGEPAEIFPFIGCSRLAEAIDRFDNVKAIFHGHAHHGALRGQTPRGVPVHNCCIELLRKTGEQPYVIVAV